MPVPPRRLLASAFFPLRAGSIALVSRPLLPAAGRGCALRAAVAAQGVSWMEGTFTAFQQTAAPSQTRGAILNPSRCSIILRLGHGELLLPDGQVSLRSCCFAARRFLNPPRLPTARCLYLQHNQPPTPSPAISTSRNQPARLRNWSGQWPRLTAGAGGGADKTERFLKKLTARESA